MHLESVQIQTELSTSTILIGEVMKTTIQGFSLMRVMLSFAGFLFVLFSGCAPVGVYHARARVVVNAPINREYDIQELNLYGEWISVSHFGRVWRPYVMEGWRPFHHGHWVSTDEGWAWISYEPFGWITYHYGNWYPSADRGWVWVPGHGEWSPARVQWVQYEDYVGWAPLAPAGIAWSQPWERSELDVWAVVHTADVTRDFVGEHRIARGAMRIEVQRDKVIQRAPDPIVIEKQTQQKVETVKIERETVVVGKGQFHKMIIPEREKERVEKYRSKVEKEVVKRPDQGEHR